MKDLYIQKGFVKFLSKDAERKPLNMLFNLTRWFKGVHGSADTVTKAGEVCLDTAITLFVTTAATAFTLADGCNGQEKILKMKTDGGDATITVDNLNGGTTITLNDAGDMVKLVWVDNKWYPTSNFGALIA